MERKEMISSDIPKLNGTTKDLINSGIWFLYKINYETVPEAKYCLSADQTYLLDSEGSIISKDVVLPKEIVLDTPITFSDLPKPPVQKNLVLSWAF